MMDAERSHLPGQWRVRTPLETDFLSDKTATRMLQQVHSAMRECVTIEQGYKKALELLIQMTEATHGYIYSIGKKGLELVAPIEGNPALTTLDSRLTDYLDSWNANRTGQQIETQTLASRTLTKAAITERSSIITNDDTAYQPLLLWVENQERPEMVCVAALATPELPLEDLLWPFTSVIANYLAKLRIPG
jgi:Ca2+-dependent lipid-binding protein